MSYQKILKTFDYKPELMIDSWVSLVFVSLQHNIQLSLNVIFNIIVWSSPLRRRQSEVPFVKHHSNLHTESIKIVIYSI